MTDAGKSDPAAAPPEGPAAAKGGLHAPHLPLPPRRQHLRRSLGVYVFAKTYKRDQEKKNDETAAAAAAAALSSPASATAKTAEPTPPPKRVRQVYKWMLEEKRKIKPRNAAEKNKINEEKALLKEFIQAVSLPSLL